MTPRHIALVLAAVAVFGFGVYVYLASSSTPPAVANNVRSRSPAPVAARGEPDAEPKDATNARRDRSSEKRVTDHVKRAAAPAGETKAPELGPEAEDFKKDEVMASANKAYDRGDFDEAIVIAKRVLSNEPGNVRMLRIVVSASCILGDNGAAQSSYLSLPMNGTDRADMKKRCDRYGVTFTES